MPTNVACEPSQVTPANPTVVTHPVAYRNHQRRSSENGHRLAALLNQTHIIPSVRAPEFITQSVQSPGKLVYFLFGNPEDIAGMVQAVAAAGKIPMVNIDLATGLSRDEAAIAYLAHRQVRGIISTHVEPLRAARELGMFAIKRTFLLDHAALECCLNSLKQFQPDALEVMPAIAAPRILLRLRQMYPELPVIAGGLITNLREIEYLVEQGVTSVSVSDSRLWVA